MLFFHSAKKWLESDSDSDSDWFFWAVTRTQTRTRFQSGDSQTPDDYWWATSTYSRVCYTIHQGRQTVYTNLPRLMSGILWAKLPSWNCPKPLPWPLATPLVTWYSLNAVGTGIQGGGRVIPSYWAQEFFFQSVYVKTEQHKYYIGNSCACISLEHYRDKELSHCRIIVCTCHMSHVYPLCNLVRLSPLF